MTMNRVLAPLAVLLCLLAPAAWAQSPCYADYKAKRDNPLRLQYGVYEVQGRCTPAAAAEELGALLAADGWELLEVVGVFGAEGLEEREEDAGDNFLRY